MKQLLLKIFLTTTFFCLLIVNLKSQDTDFVSHLNEEWNADRNEMKVHSEFLPDFDKLRNENIHIFQWKYTVKASELKKYKAAEVHIINFTKGDEKALEKFCKKSKEYINIEAIRIGAFHLDEMMFDQLMLALADKKHFKKLIISVCKVKKIPDSIRNLKYLETFDIANNQVTELPEAFTELSNLRYLRVRNNRSMSQLPDLLGNFKNLEYLDFSGTKMKGLPDSIGGCKYLAKIVGNACELKYIPASIGDCSQLRDINFGYNKIASIPIEFGKLSRLESLSLGGNELSDLPITFGHLSNLWFCGLAHNKFTEFPKEVLELTRVGNLWLHGNTFKNLPIELADLKSLSHLLINESVINPKDIQMIKDKNPEIRIIHEQ